MRMSDDASKGNTKKRQIPTKLKQLAEIRARAAGELEVCLIAHKAVASSLKRQQARLKLTEEEFNESEKQRTLLTDRISVIDTQIKEFAPNVNPENIAPIRATKGKYSAYGTLRAFILITLKVHAPKYIPSSELSQIAINAFNLKFASVALCKRWRDTSMITTLHGLERDGLIERNPIMGKGKTGPTNSWRIKIETPMRLSDL